MNKYFFAILFCFSLFGTLFAQPDLRIEPRNIRFEDIFSRYEYANIINNGDQPLSIDSLSPVKNYYLLDFENHPQLPFSINPGDTVRLNVTLANFYNITVSDTSDTVWVYSNDPESPRDLRIKIDFFDDDLGDCSGIISDENLIPLPDAKVYFFYYGIYLFDSTSTDITGNYSKQLPTGSYTVAAEKEGYRVMFSGNTPDPFYAASVSLDSGQTVNVDITLPPIINTGYSVSGVLIDSIYGTPIDKGVVVVRKGSHTPTLLKPNALIADSSVYAGFIRSDGSYNVIVEDTTYYFVQGYTEYYLPTYFNNLNNASVFWQQADSIFIDQAFQDRNLYVVRDSSFGGGLAYGLINLPFFDAHEFDGISIFAKSLDNNSLYSYNFGKEDGSFYLYNLPYGTYQLVAQKVGLPNAFSNQFTISPANPDQRDLIITFTLSEVQDEENLIPETIKLYNSYPNPFNPSTKIKFSIPNNISRESGNSNIKLIIYDILGNEISKLVDEEKLAGTYEVIFDATNFASGVYIVSLQTSSVRLSQKIILMK